MSRISNIKAKIKTEIEENTSRIKHHIEVQRSKGDSSEAVDVTQDESNKAESRRVLNELSARNDALNKALFRIKNDTYLDCKTCLDEITEERLEATLVAELCIYCANKEFAINKIIQPKHNPSFRRV
ncbi:TraR/DksA family transcriptional regulator [Pseudoalteromonas marina]|uniref:TraR/DksA C4-type zinc finger protein n=1 Tax=Pseudoalteromonas marina TaxID=267375 RepID=A0ABT9FGI6_9GAMM|nr:TraR/DksA C4-type zinc finger protein [Pseudoalteromonas marina]MDP2565856.1 TraR/DksA C4-type zinc finger protein [Pseudoalteromonas marina]